MSNSEMTDRTMTLPDELVAERLDTVRTAITDLGRADVQIVAVTKGFDESAVHTAKQLRLTQVGENYAQEIIEKTDDFVGLTVNFLGRIQRNKVRKVCEVVDVWQSVARPEILREIGKRTENARVLIQIQPEGDDSKDGVRPPHLPEMFAIADELGVQVEGLMTIGVLGNPEATTRCFSEVAGLADEYEVPVRSMGMSGDYREALVAGSTMLRLGSVLFGPRPT